MNILLFVFPGQSGSFRLEPDPRFAPPFFRFQLVDCVRSAFLPKRLFIKRVKLFLNGVVLELFRDPLRPKRKPAMHRFVVVHLLSDLGLYFLPPPVVLRLFVPERCSSTHFTSDVVRHLRQVDVLADQLVVVFDIVLVAPGHATSHFRVRVLAAFLLVRN